MKRRVSIAIAAAAALVLVFVLAGCSSTSQNYKPEAKAATVSDSQLVKAGTLTVGVNASNPPLAGQTSSYVGIDVDVAAAMADELGLKLNIVDVKSDPASALAAHTVDFVLGIDSTLKYDNVTLTDNYLPTGIALFSTKASATVPTATSNSTFSAQASSVSAWEITNQFGASSLTSTTDLASTFDNLATGTVDFAVADAVVGMYAAHKDGYDVYIVGMVTKPTGYCAGVASSNTSMKSIVDTALKTVSSNGMIDVIEKKWLGTTLALSALPVTGTSSTSTSAKSTTNDAANTTSTEAADEAAAEAVANEVVDAVDNAVSNSAA